MNQYVLQTEKLSKSFGKTEILHISVSAMGTYHGLCCYGYIDFINCTFV